MPDKSISPIRFVELKSPIGTIRIEGTAETITAIHLPGSIESIQESITALDANETLPALEAGAKWLKAYFQGRPEAPQKMPLPEFNGFRDKVYEALMRVPFGATVSYGELAQMAGRPGAARAVGQMMATNPLAILIPCHRVIGSDGGLHGYGGGLDMKKKLLEHEGVKVK